VLNMPTVIQQNGFDVMIYIRDEHPPAHVHVWKAEGEVIIHLETPAVHEVKRMSRPDVRAALAIVEENREMLLGEWRRIHG